MQWGSRGGKVCACPDNQGTRVPHWGDRSAPGLGPWRGFLEDVDLNWACVGGKNWLSSEGPPNMEVEVNTKSQAP